MSEHALPRRRPAPVARPNGWWGMAIFVASEATLFGALLGTYYYLRFKALNWPPPGVPDPKIALPLILTAILVATSLPMQAALRAARSGRRSASLAALAMALAVQSAYFGVQMHLYLADLDKVRPGETAYGSSYVTLLGAHHTHVAVGLLLNLWLLLRLSTGLTSYRVTGLWATTFYWHFVNVLAVFVVLTQLSPSL
jgi:cytochrome c oxidase subunit III